MAAQLAPRCSGATPSAGLHLCEPHTIPWQAGNQGSKPRPRTLAIRAPLRTPDNRPGYPPGRTRARAALTADCPAQHAQDWSGSIQVNKRDRGKKERKRERRRGEGGQTRPGQARTRQGMTVEGKHPIYRPPPTPCSPMVSPPQSETRPATIDSASHSSSDVSRPFPPGQ
jgi:hypothetical protein